ncbi:hypothetical protein SUDANB6_00712 [Streptomyces sp. enrichment culture]
MPSGDGARHARRPPRTTASRGDTLRAEDRSDGGADQADGARRTDSRTPRAVSALLVVLTAGRETKDAVLDGGDVPTAPGRNGTPAATAVP